MYQGGSQTNWGGADWIKVGAVQYIYSHSSDLWTLVADVYILQIYAG